MVSPSQAQRAALADFGGTEQVKEQVPAVTDQERPAAPIST
jgi:hypothetical protein